MSDEKRDKTLEGHWDTARRAAETVSNWPAWKRSSDAFTVPRAEESPSDSERTEPGNSRPEQVCLD